MKATSQDIPRTCTKRGTRASLSRRDFLRAAGLLAGGVALHACAPSGGTEDTGASDEISLVYQDWRTEWFPPMVQEMLEKFHANHPGIHVFYIPDPEDYETEMLADFQAGTAPDVFQACCTHFPIWAQKGFALDLTPYIEADLTPEIINDWDPAQYHSFFLKSGLQYGLPKYHGALALYYNKDLFDGYSVEYPDGSWTHDDYLHAMKLLTDDRDGDGEVDQWGSIIDISWDRIQVHVNGWDGHFVSPTDPAQCWMGKPEAMEALDWLRARIWEDYVMTFSPPGEGMGTRNAFISGQVAMAEDGSWALRDILSGARFRVGIAPFPSGPAKKVTLATTDGFGIYSGTEHPEASWELMKFLISPDYGRAMARTNFLQPARASLVEDWVKYVRAEFPEQTHDVDIAAFADGQLKGYSAIAEVFPNMSEAKRLAYDAWQKILVLGEAKVEIMQETSRLIDAAQESSG